MTRFRWTERTERPGWDVRYTLVGGRWRGRDPLGDLPDSEVHLLQRYVAQAFVACTEARSEPSPDVDYWATVCTKLIQRGTNPAISHRAERLLGGPPAPPRSAAEDDRAIVLELLAETETAWTLEPAIELHPTWEAPFLQAVGRRRPDLLRWITPQAPLEPMARDGGGTSRWVDFLLWHPRRRAVVIEIDGSGHARQPNVDRERDRLLRAAKIDVVRVEGKESLDVEALMQRLDLGPHEPRVAHLSASGRELRRMLLAPAELHRLGLGIVLSVVRGFLPARAPWEIELEDSLGCIGEAAGPILDFLAAVDDLWGTGVVPNEVRVGHVRWRRRGGRFIDDGRVDVASGGQVRIVLDVDHPPHAALPEGDLPRVVIRHAFLPAKLAWLPGRSSERRSVEPGEAGPLEVLLEELFGLGGFREGQLAPIQRVLSGGDCAVMLPTGAGKSLLYQLASLVRPGIGVVIDPIVSLIDDQARRLREEGIDRVSALHAAAVRRANSSGDVYQAVASGEALFVFLTPERLQIQSFREHLGAAAEHQLVNLAVVDEAHCVSEWGHDFRTSYLRLGRNLRLLCRSLDDTPPPILAMTGTASPAVLRDVLREVDIDPSEDGALQRPATFDRPNLHYKVVADEPGVLQAHLREQLLTGLPEALGVEPDQLYRASGPSTFSGLIFVPHTNGRHGVVQTRERIRSYLGRKGIAASVEIYSGQCPKEFEGEDWDAEKAEAAKRFKRNESPVMVSTKAFGMGIDKSNIRYTVHVGFPSSIEAFAQEAGRAGRDTSSDAQCVLLAALPEQRLADEELDVRRNRDERVATYQLEGNRDDDLAHQLFFLYRSFPSVGLELQQAVEVFDELWQGAQPRADLTIPRGPRSSEAESSYREKALYRLSVLGIVDDYTVDFGANTLTVYLDYFDSAAVDEAFLDYAQRIEPGRRAAHERSIAQAPSDLAGRVRHHLKLQIEMLYRVIEPARLRALEEMYRLTLGSPTEDDLRKRINAYLGDGALAATLPRLIGDASRISVDEVIDALSAAPPLDSFEWAGAAARQLEDTPDHPVALTVSALGQAWLPTGDQDLFRERLTAGLEGLVAYDVPAAEAARVFAWTLSLLRNQMGGFRRDWSAVAWSSLPLSLDREQAVVEEEQRVLRHAAQDPRETQVVLDRRIGKLAADVDQYVLVQISE